MHITCIGLNHKTAPVAAREKLAFTQKQQPEFLRQLRSQGLAEEGVVLSTCNRVELYTLSDPSSSEEIRSRLLSFHELRLEDLGDCLYEHTQAGSVEHLFGVASGLDSMIVGETEILGQVKSAYEAALDSGTTGKVLNQLFQRALNTAKEVRTRTGIGEGTVSVGGAAVHLAEKIFTQLSGKRVVVVGAGAMGQAVLQSLVGRGVRAVVVSNRRLDRARDLAQAHGATAVQLDADLDYLLDPDIAICSTACPVPVIHEN
ncbi:MAG: glutamyl-tRNA reductase, partial [Candidatus Omnitrophica bacterium]|nr:glutamyl-tRNA reductase [Candidatus Omnitrophota bacterium]